AKSAPPASPVFGSYLVGPRQFTSFTVGSIGTVGGSFSMVFGIGIDGQAHSARFDTNGDQVNGWVRVAPGQFRSLAAGQFGAGNPELFGIGPDNQVYGARFDPNGNLINGWFLVAPGSFRSVSAGKA